MTDSDSPSMVASGGPTGATRRRAIAAVAVVAAVVGVGSALWREEESEKIAESPDVESLWALEWQTPTGAILRMQNFRGRPLLINFWATWCPPCVEELPLINRFYLENQAKGWQVLALAIDKPEAVRSFLARMPLDFPIGMAGLAGAELGKSLGNFSGGLPFSVVFGSSGSMLHRKVGRLREEDLNAWVDLK